MRPLEIILPILLAAYLLWPFFAPRPRVVKALPTISLLLIGLHLLTEGWRWQMIPMYVLLSAVFLASLPAFLRPGQPGSEKPRGWCLLAAILSLVLLAMASLLPALLPVPELLAPTGPYPVGTRTIVLTDTNRKELYSGKDEPRRFMVQIWYPAVPPPAGTKQAPWMSEARIVAPAIAQYIELPVFFLDHLVLSHTDSYENIPVRPGEAYPLLLFSHGWNGFRQQSTFLMEELASHGYIVAAMEHPYGARLTVFPDGSIVPNNPAALPKGKPQDEYEVAARILVNQWSGDLAYALDYFTQLNQADPQGQFTGQIDITRVGVFGHSTGGGATVQFCGTDPRCKVGVTLDAFMRPVGTQVLDGGTRQPFLYLFSELWPFERNTELFNRYYSHVSPSNRVITILGADHYDFSDLPALSPLAPQLGLKGPINGTRVQRIINTYVLAYFNQQFKNTPTQLFDGPQTDYPELRYDK